VAKDVYHIKQEKGGSGTDATGDQGTEPTQIGDYSKHVVYETDKKPIDTIENQNLETNLEDEQGIVQN